MPMLQSLRQMKQKFQEFRHPDLASICETIIEQRLSFLEKRALFELASAAQACRDLEGHAVECGTALGGSAIAILAGLGPDRTLSLHDVFGLIPPPSNKDGETERQRYVVIASGAASGFGEDRYYGYEPDLQERIRENIAMVLGTEALDQVVFRKGLFAQTLNDDAPLCFAHLDGDWYESTLSALEGTWPRLVSGAIMVVDDYHAWDGCRRAVDDYFANRPRVIIHRRARLHMQKP
jgi:O-methyltransferase